MSASPGGRGGETERKHGMLRMASSKSSFQRAVSQTDRQTDARFAVE